MADQKFFDAQTKQPLQVPVEQANDAIVAGKLLPENKVLYNAVDSEGGFYKIPGSQLAQALKDGLTLESKEAETERKFGKDDIKAGAAGLARGLTFGLSDVALTESGLVEPETLSGLEEANPISSATGEIAGVAAPLVLSGGLGAAGIGVRGASRAGLALEAKVASAGVKALQKAGISSKVAQSLVTKGFAKGIGSAAEASLYGVGNAISESALGRADLNAENVLASAKDFAVFGGLAGTGIGLAGSALSAGGKKLAESEIGKRVKGQLDDFVSPGKGVEETLDRSLSKQIKADKYQSEIQKELPEYFKTQLETKLYDSVENLAKKNEDNLAKVGQQIDTLLTDTNALQAQSRVGMTVADYKKSIKESADSLLGADQAVKKSADNLEYKFITKERDRLLADAADFGDDLSLIPISRLQALRKGFDSKINFLADIDATARSKFNYSMRTELRELIDDSISKIEREVPDAVGSLARLKELNKNYHLGASVSDDLTKAAAKAERSELVNTKDLIAGSVGSLLSGSPIGAALGLLPKFARSQTLNNMRILGQIEKANLLVKKTIDTSVNNFFKPVAVIAPRAAYTILDSDLSKDGRKKSDNPQTAFNNAKTNLARVKSDYNGVLENINRRTAFMYKAAPETASQIDAKSFNALQFLQSKLPLDIAPKGMIQELKQKQRVSNLQLAKFQRYISAVEQPLDVIKDFSRGNVSREGVETLKAVYPNMYENLRNTVMDKVAENPDGLSYQKRLQLGTLLNIPTDTSLLPQNIMALQQNINTEVGSQDGASVDSTVGGLQGINKAARTDLAGDSELD